MYIFVYLGHDVVDDAGDAVDDGLVGDGLGQYDLGALVPGRRLPR